MNDMSKQDPFLLIKFLVGFFVAVLLTLLLATYYLRVSFEKEKTSREYIIAQMNSQKCPIILGGGVGEVSKITYEDGYLVYNICYRDEYVGVETIRGSKVNFAEIVGCILRSLRDPKELLDFLEKHRMGMKLAIRNDSGDTCSLVCSFEDIENSYYMHAGVTRTESLCKGLEFNVEMYNRELPMLIDEWLWLDSFSVEGDTLFMNYMVDSAGYDVNEMDFSGITIMDVEMTEDEKILYEVLMGMCKSVNCHFAIRFFDKDTQKEAVMFTDKKIIKQINTHSYIDKF